MPVPTPVLVMALPTLSTVLPIVARFWLMLTPKPWA